MGRRLLMGSGGSVGSFPAYHSRNRLPPGKRGSAEGGWTLVCAGGENPLLILHLIQTPTPPQMKIEWKQVNGYPVAEFPNGETIHFYPSGGGTLTRPAKGDVGSFSFPLRHAGDAFHAIRLGRPIPDHCKGW